MLIDSMKLAYETFQSCRRLLPETEALLTVLIPTLDEVRERGVLVLEVPDSRIEPLSSYYKRKIGCGPEIELSGRVSVLESSRRLLDLCYVAAVDLTRLWVAGARGAVLSLGYALHIVPSLVTSGKALDPKLYEFNFRIAAFHWVELSPEMREAMANAAGHELERAERLARSDGFAIDMVGSSRTTK